MAKKLPLITLLLVLSWFTALLGFSAGNWERYKEFTENSLGFSIGYPISWEAEIDTRNKQVVFVAPVPDGETPEKATLLSVLAYKTESQAADLDAAWATIQEQSHFETSEEDSVFCSRYEYRHGTLSIPESEFGWKSSMEVFMIRAGSRIYLVNIFLPVDQEGLYGPALEVMLESIRFSDLPGH